MEVGGRGGKLAAGEGDDGRRVVSKEGRIVVE